MSAESPNAAPESAADKIARLKAEIAALEAAEAASGIPEVQAEVPVAPTPEEPGEAAVSPEPAAVAEQRVADTTALTETKERLEITQTGTSEEPHDEHIKVWEEENKEIFRKRLERSKERLSQLSSTDSVLSLSDSRSKFWDFFFGLVLGPTYAGVDGRVVLSNLDEIRQLAKQGIDIYYQALKASPPKENELEQMAYGAREITEKLLVERSFNSNQPRNYIPLLSEEDYKKLRESGEFTGKPLDQKRAREQYPEARKIISEL